MLWEISQESCGKSCGLFCWKSCGNAAWQGGGDKSYLRKEVIGGNLAFGIGWRGSNQSIFSLGNSVGNLVGNAAGNLVENSMGNLVWNSVGNLVGNLAGNLVENSAENLVGTSAGNLLGNAVEQGGGDKVYLRKGSDWWKFRIWNRVMGD